MKWEGVAPGILVDDEIRALGEAGIVISKNFNSGAVEQSFYEFHVGKEFVDLSRPEEERHLQLKDGEQVLIRPHSQVVVKMAEEINVPHDCVINFILKGKWFSVGLAPINTAADPGFSGHMGIVLMNLSSRYVKIPVGEVLVKAEIVKLHKPVAESYRGQHGFRTGHWPIVKRFVASTSDLHGAGIRPSSIGEIRRSHGDVIADAIQQTRYYSKVVWLQLTAVIIFLSIILYFHQDLGPVVSIVLGVGSNLLTSIVIAAYRRLFPEKAREMLEG